MTFAAVAEPPGLTLSDGLSYDEWVKVGERLRHNLEGTQWRLGDWLVYAESRGEWGKRFVEAQRITGCTRPTLARYYRVAKAFQRDVRSSAVSWTFYWMALRLPEPIRLSSLERVFDKRFSLVDFERYIAQTSTSERRGGSRKNVMCPKCSHVFPIHGNRVSRKGKKLVHVTTDKRVAAVKG